MNLIRAATAIEQFAATLERQPINVAPGRCIRALCKAVECDRCASVCPVAAIRLEREPTLDAEKCVGCGLCQHVCPTGAFEGHDPLPALLNCIASLPDHEVIELTCARHPDAAHGERGVDAVVRTTGCLAAFGASAYASLAALGVMGVILRVDACAQCPIGGLKAEIIRAGETLRELLGRPDALQVIDQGHPGKLNRAWRKRPILAVNNTPLSRRNFFRRLTGQADQPAKALIALPDENDPKRALPRERHRLVRAIALIPRTNRAKGLPRQAGFTGMTAAESCSACGTCARVCPTGALKLVADEANFRLEFDAVRCVDCGVCLRFCKPGALTRTSPPPLDEVLDDMPRVLASGALRRCQKCGAHFAGQPEGENGDLCPVCSHKRKMFR